MKSSFKLLRLFSSLLLVWFIALSYAYAEEPKSTIQSPVVFQSLEQMDELVELGMPALALRLLKQEQQHWPIYSPDWYAFEQKHIVLLSAVDDWQSVITRTETLLTNAKPGEQITEEISRWFISQQIVAWLKLRQPEKALSQLRALLWNADNPVNDSDLIALWRRLVVRAYLLMNADADAQQALLRYRQDYGNNHLNLNHDWRLLQARVLLRLKRPDEVIDLLQEPESHIEKALRLVAAIRARPKNTSLYVKEIEKKLAERNLDKNRTAEKILRREEVWAYRYVLYEAALSNKDFLKASITLRDLLAMGHSHPALGEEFSVGGDDLWKLYESVGNKIGNRLKLLLGDDVSWYDKASELQEKQPDEALGLYTVLAFNARDKSKQQLAHKEIVALLVKNADGLELVNQLYLHGSKISSVKSLPLEVRYRLVDYALSKGDITLAARLMQSLQQPPEGQNVFDWRMRKARVLILEGKYEAGEKVLTKTINENTKLIPEQMDHFLQVVFDVQTVERHKQALRLFDLLKEDWLNDKIRLELFFWRAESYFALKQYGQASWLYLKSALMADRVQYGLWAESARFKAAGSLTKAGLYDDAQKIYTELLSYAGTESKKSVIKQKLQHIRLLRNTEKSNAEKSRKSKK
jgi:hypothetical protein